MKDMKKLHHRTLLALAVASAFPLQAFAADDTAPAAKDKDTGQLETVIVTAQRRSENIKDVPMSISAMKGDKLDAVTASGQDIRFLAARTPSLNVESDFGRTFPRFYIRGLGNTDFDMNASQPVGLVYDDVVQESPALKGFPVFDVDQIEVLRGPQGTLFGRNSPAGVIKFESTKPTNKFEGYGNFGFGKDTTINAEGALNIPLDKNWAMRVSVLDQHRNNRVHNPIANSPTHDLEGYNDKAARVQLQYKDANLTANVSLHGRDYTGNATLFRANIIKAGTNDIVPGFRYDYYPTDGGNTQTLSSHGAVVHLKYALPEFTLHAITGWDKAKYYSWGDVDGGFGAVYAPPMGPNYPGQNAFIPFDAQTADGIPDLKQVTQEFRVESNYQGPLQWIGGLYYFKEDIQVDSFNFSTFANNAQHGYAVQHQHAKSWAAFGSLNYAVSDVLKLRAGIRYTDDKKDFDAARLVNPFDNNPGIGPLTTHPHATNTSWDLSGTYELDKNTNLFSRIATGYRAPSIQGRILFGDTISVANSEHNTSFELGLKEDLFGKRARLTAAFFHYEVKDLQLTAGSGTTNQNKLVNAAKAVGQGVELDAQAILSDELRATLGASYNDTEIRDPNLTVLGCGAPCAITNPFTLVGGSKVVSINGNPLPRAPKWTGSFTLRWAKPVGDGEVYAYTDWNYKSSWNMFLYEAKEYKAKSLTEGGLRVGYKWGDGKYEVAGYVRNILDKVQIVAAIDFNNLTGIVNDPRTYGAQFKVNF